MENKIRVMKIKKNDEFLKTSDILKNLRYSYIASGDISKGIEYFEQMIQLLSSDYIDGIKLRDMYQMVGDVLLKHEKVADTLVNIG